MNDTLTLADEDRLRRLLHERAELAQPSPFARAALQRRLDAPARPARMGRRVAAAAAVIAAAGVGIVTQTTGPVVVTADGGGGAPRTEATPVTTTAPSSVVPRPLPRLVLGDERFSVRHLEDHESDPAVDDTGRRVYSQVFRSASGAVAAPSLTVRSIPAGVAYGIGEDAPADVVERVDVAGRVGFLVQAEALSPSLGVRFADGSAVHLKAVGMPGAALVEIARSMERRTGAAGWNLAVSALAPVVEGEVRYGGLRSSELDYEAGGEQVTVRVAQGDRLRFEDQLLDRADAATTYEAVTVRGASGVLFTIDGEYLALWFEDGIVGEVRSTLDRDATVTLLGGLREVPEEAWASLRP